MVRSGTALMARLRALTAPGQLPIPSLEGRRGRKEKKEKRKGKGKEKARKREKSNLSPLWRKTDGTKKAQTQGLRFETD